MMEISGFLVAQQLPGGRFGSRVRAEGPPGEVVLKELAGLDPDAAKSAIEAMAPARRLRHPNLAGSHEPVTDSSGRAWLVEEWVDGVSLAALTEEHTLSTGQALGVARGLLSGLAAAHIGGVVHGTLSPTTVMLTLHGEPRLIDTGTWVVDPEIAATSEQAAPETRDGRPPGPAADVFAAGRTIGQLLSVGPLDARLADVLARATSPDPATRQPDANALLSDVTRAAERAYGPLWWTLEGVGGAVASMVGAAGGTASTGAAAAGLQSGAGTVTGSLTAGNAAIVAGAEGGTGGAGIVQGTVKTTNRLRKLIPVIVGGVVVIVGGGIAFAATVGGPNRSAGTVSSVAVTAPAATPSATPTPSPTPTPPLAAGFDGTYQYTTVRTRTNLPRFPVGEKQSGTWQVSTTCSGELCETTVTRDGQAIPIAASGDGWLSDDRYDAECIDLDTGKPIEDTTRYRTVRKLTVDEVVDGQVVRLVGTSRTTQLDKCTDQFEPRGKFTYKVTMTRKG